MAVVYPVVNGLFVSFSFKPNPHYCSVLCLSLFTSMIELFYVNDNALRTWHLDTVTSVSIPVSCVFMKECICFVVV
jgi:hypothetical protein